MMFGLTVMVAGILADRYPDGCTLEELREEAMESHEFIRNVPNLLENLLGNENGRPHAHADVACWELRDNRYYFTPNAEIYSSYDEYGVKRLVQEHFNKRRNRPRTGD